uniref:At1g61320/AtMIF1 LRR domain-containing protein n=1 Tax=Hordeum vulgare subsp. vulgare TaxID=112509 RepID=A0A8I6WRA9_HORVV
MEVLDCLRLKVIENKAPNISNFQFVGNEVQLSLGKSLQVKSLKLHHRCVISHAIDKLPSIVPNLERLNIIYSHETNTGFDTAISYPRAISYSLHGWSPLPNAS